MHGAGCTTRAARAERRGGAGLTPRGASRWTRRSGNGRGQATCPAGGRPREFRGGGLPNRSEPDGPPLTSHFFAEAMNPQHAPMIHAMNPCRMCARPIAARGGERDGGARRVAERACTARHSHTRARFGRRQTGGRGHRAEERRLMNTPATRRCGWGLLAALKIRAAHHVTSKLRFPVVSRSHSVSVAHVCGGGGEVRETQHARSRMNTHTTA